MLLGQMIKICRKDKNFTQSDLAEQIGVSVQSVSKWETGAGMPDISQIVPLARVLEVSTDKLLGLSVNDDEEFKGIKEKIKETGFSWDNYKTEEAGNVYGIIRPYFQKHPNNPEAAMWCLLSLVNIIASDNTERDKQQLTAEGERYGNCIFRYETNADTICKAYYVMARFYNLIDEKEKAN